MISLSENPLQTLAVFGIGFAVFFILRSAVVALISPLRTVPGPFAARFTRLWELRKTTQHQFEHVNLALHKRYGKSR